MRKKKSALVSIKYTIIKEFVMHIVPILIKTISSSISNCAKIKGLKLTLLIRKLSEHNFVDVILADKRHNKRDNNNQILFFM